MSKSCKPKSRSAAKHARGGLVPNTTQLRATQGISRQAAVAKASTSGGRQGSVPR